MAESMVGLKRSHRCTEVTSAQIGEKVTVMGWVQKSRNKGGIIFVDLRDRSGILQIIFEENDCGTENFEKAEKLRSEFVIAVEGRVEARSGAVNENLATGAIEVRAESLRILAESETPPFPIEEKSKTKEDLRLEYRFLDLRRPDIGDKCHVPALTAAVDAGCDCTDSRRLTGDTDLHRAIRLCGHRRSNRCAVACHHADRLPGKCIAERIGHPRPQRVRRRTVCL